MILRLATRFINPRRCGSRRSFPVGRAARHHPQRCNGKRSCVRGGGASCGITGGGVICSAAAGELLLQRCSAAKETVHSISQRCRPARFISRRRTLLRGSGPQRCGRTLRLAAPRASPRCRDYAQHHLQRCERALHPAASGGDDPGNQRSDPISPRSSRAADALLARDAYPAQCYALLEPSNGGRGGLASPIPPPSLGERFAPEANDHNGRR